MQIYKVTPNLEKHLLERNLYKVQSSACEELEHPELFSGGNIHSVKVTSILPDTMP